MSTSNYGTKRKGGKNLQDTPFENILQGAATNALTSTSKKQAEYDEATHRATIEKDNVSIMLEEADRLPLDAQSNKVLDILVMAMTKNFPHYSRNQEVDANEIKKHREVTISLSEYMTACGLKDVKTARAQLEKSIRSLYNTTINYTEKRTVFKGKKRTTEEIQWNMRVIDTVASATTINEDTKIIENGRVTVKFSFDIAEYFAKAQIMPYPTNLLQINGKHNPNAFHIGRKLMELFNMNKGKRNAGIVSIKTLLENAPNIPTYEEIKEKSRQIDKRIITPLENELNALRDVYHIITSWEYCGAKGKPLTDEELQDNSFETYQKRNVKYVINTKHLPPPAQTE